MGDLFRDDDDGPSLFGKPQVSEPPKPRTDPTQLPSLPPVPEARPPPAPIASPSVAERMQPAESANAEPRVVQEHVDRPAPATAIAVMRQRDVVRKALNQLRRTIDSKFDDIRTRLEGIVLEEAPVGPPVDADRVLRDAQAAVRAADAKDAELALLDARLGGCARGDDRAAARAEASRLAQEAAAEAARFSDAVATTRALEARLGDLQLEVAGLPEAQGRSERELRAWHEGQLRALQGMVSSAGSAAQARIDSARKALASAAEEMAKLESEARVLVNQRPKVSQADFERFEEEATGEVREVIERMARVTDETVEEGVNAERSYTGVMVLGACQRALQYAMQDVVG